MEYPGKSWMLALALIVLGVGCSASQGPGLVPSTEVPVVATTTISTTTPETATTTVGAKKAAVPKTTAPPPKASAPPLMKNYQDALDVYRKSGYYLQIVNCHASPTSLVLKKGAYFMIDNRDDRARHFVIGKLSYSIKAYSYAIATAQSIGTYNMTCDGGGSAQLVVQP